MKRKDLENTFEELFQDALSNGKEVTLSGEGYCMEPLLAANDKISFKKLEVKKLRKYDLVLIRDKKGFFVHRFIRLINKDGFIYLCAKSDVSRKTDPLIAESDFIGIVTRIGKKDKEIVLESLEGKMKSLWNHFIAAPYSCIKTEKEKCKKKSLKNEKELLILTTKTPWNEKDKNQVKTLLPKIRNWNYIFDKVKHNLIATLFYRNFSISGLIKQVPAEIREKIKEIYHWQIYKDTKIQIGLKKVLAELNRNNIRVMITKGAHLSHEVYDDTFLRWMGDVDILAKLDDWPKIKTVLRQLGFKSRDHMEDSWGLRYLDNHLMFHNDFLKLEIKFNIWLMDFPYFENKLWSRARMAVVADERVLVPSPEDALMISCVNLTRHNYSGLIWMCDIREVLSVFRNDLDWDKFFMLAKKNDIECVVYYSLFYSSKLLNYNISDWRLNSFEPTFIKKFLHKFFWDEKVILWEKEGSLPRAKFSFELAAIFFAGKLKFYRKKLLRMTYYVFKVAFPDKRSLTYKNSFDSLSKKFILSGFDRFKKVTFFVIKEFACLILGKTV